MRGRRGAKKAIGAVAASILTASYHMLTNGTLYQDPGGDYFDIRTKNAQTTFEQRTLRRNVSSRA
jgi:transposase